jgi:transposase
MESTTSIEAVLDCGEQLLEVRHLAIRPDLIVIQLARRSDSVACPHCGSPSHRVHSRYMRTISDLPWRGTPVVLRWEVRRFCCDDESCRQRIFAERLEPLVMRRARTTNRLDETLAIIGMECGGEPGRRLSSELGIHTSGDSILRRVRALPLDQKLSPRMIGIDDFALRKGQRYGTVLVDHESHQVIDLLPDRSSESTAEWLKSQPQVELVTRDRSTLYAKGISASNPNAIQVADRFHLHANLRDALVRLLDRHHAEISAAAKVAAENAQALKVSKPTDRETIRGDVVPETAESDAQPIITSETAPLPALPDPATLSKPARLSMERRARRLEKYQKVVALQDSGMSLRAISQQLGLGRDLVTKFLRAGTFPERAKTRRPCGNNPIAGELRRLWDSNIHNARELHRRLCKTGFTGSYQMVCRQVAPWRDAEIQSHTPGRNAHRPSQASPSRISSNRLSWLLLQGRVEQEPGEEELVQQLLSTCEPVRSAFELALEFKQVMAAGQSEPLRHWIDRASDATVPMEIRAFAEGLDRDWASVKAAVEMRWSNGRAEGHVNRIKLIKRKMYGRANFDLLRIRVMARGP